MVYQKAKSSRGWLYIESSHTGQLQLSCEFGYGGSRIFDELPRLFKTPAACKAYVTRQFGEKLDWEVVATK